MKCCNDFLLWIGCRPLVFDGDKIWIPRLTLCQHLHACDLINSWRNRVIPIISICDTVIVLVTSHVRSGLFLLVAET